MTSASRAFAKIPLLLSPVNMVIGAIFFERGKGLLASSFTVAFPAVILWILHSFLRDGRFYWKRPNVGGPRHLVTVQGRPGAFWFMIGFLTLFYLAATSLLSLGIVYGR
jgi:hypothetical protein